MWPLLVTTKSFCYVPEKDFVALGTKLNRVGGEVVLFPLGLVPFEEIPGLVHPLLEISGRKRLATQKTSRQGDLSSPRFLRHLTMTLLDRDCSIPKLDLLGNNRIPD